MAERGLIGDVARQHPAPGSSHGLHNPEGGPSSACQLLFLSSTSFANEVVLQQTHCPSRVSGTPSLQSRAALLLVLRLAGALGLWLLSSLAAPSFLQLSACAERVPAGVQGLPVIAGGRLQAWVWRWYWQHIAFGVALQHGLPDQSPPHACLLAGRPLTTREAHAVFHATTSACSPVHTMSWLCCNQTEADYRFGHNLSIFQNYIIQET